MSLTDYMRQGNNGQVSMVLDNLPEIGFVDAIKTKNICKATLLTRSEKEGLPPGSPDVKLTSASGETLYISRRELSTNFVLSNGSKIKIAFINAGKEYIVCSVCNEPYKVIKLPDNCVGSFQGKKVRPGSYMVCKVGEDGGIDFSTAGIVSPKLFRKMFKIPPQAVIKRHVGSGNKNFTLFSNRDKARRNREMFTPMQNAVQQQMNNNVQQQAPQQQFTPRVDTSQLGLNPANINVPTAAESLKDRLNRNRQSLIRNSAAENTQDKPTNSKYRFTAINRVVDMSGNMQGFTVKDLQSGEKRQITVPQMSQLCSKKLVDNIILAKRESTGTMYLKGNGIVINNLPEVIM